jgi:predicted RNase H-like HicB family nuclease
MTKRFTYWKDGEYFVGYVNDYPDYLTQGKTLEELKENLQDIYQDLADDKIPFVRHTGELEIA